MGSKVAVAYVSLCAVSIILLFIGCTSPWHSTRFTGAGFVMLFKMKTGLLVTQVTLGDTLCKAAGKSFCKELDEGISLQHAKERFCAPIVAETLSHACDPMASAFVIGFVVFALIGINFVVLLIVNYVLYIYFSAQKPKPQYRRAAWAIHITTTGVLLIGVLIFSVEATARLDSLGGGGIPLLAQATLATGTDWGAITTFVGLAMQMTAGFLFFWMRSGEELTEEDLLTNQMRREAQREEMKKLALPQMGPTYGANGWGLATAPPAPQPLLQPQPLPPALSQPQPPPLALSPQPLQQPGPPTYQPGTPNNPAW